MLLDLKKRNRTYYYYPLITEDECAKVDSTGMSIDPHLYFEIRKDGEAVDPFEGYIDSKYNRN